MDGWRRPGCDISARPFGYMSDDITNQSNQVRETAGKFYVLWRGQAVRTPDRNLRLFDTEREAYEFLAQCDSAGGIIE
jgi:hypothetical protein